MSDKRHRDRRGARQPAFDDDQPDYFTPPTVPPARTVAPGGEPIDAVVKKFSIERGFGFVALADGSGDAFLHASTVDEARHGMLCPGLRLRVRVGPGDKGPMVRGRLEECGNFRASAAGPVGRGWCRGDSREVL
jgi:CspA family cold shock protein